MTTPQTGAPEWAAAQASPWTQVNKALRTLDGFALRTSVADRDLTAPPASCADGARYFIAAGATGDWATHDGELAIGFGTNASNGWVFATIANEGTQIWIEDEATQIEYLNSAWVTSPDRIDLLNALLDVDLSGLNDGDQIYWDASNGQWYPAPAGGVTTLGGLSDVDLTGGIPDGYVLKHDLSQGKWFPSADDNTGSGGGSAWDFVPPTAASFSLMNSDGTNLTLLDDTDVGLTANSGAGASAVGSPSRCAYRTLTTPASSWDLVVKMPSMFPLTNFSGVGIFVYNSASARSLRLANHTNEQIAVHRYSALGTYVSSLYTASINPGAAFEWFKITFDGTSYRFYYSSNGKLWALLYTEAAATYLNASGGSGDRVGFYHMISRTTGPNVISNVLYFSLTGAGV